MDESMEPAADPIPAGDDGELAAAAEPRDQVYAAIAKATGMIKRVAHDQKNSHHGFAYASIDQMMAAASDAMSECGLSVEMDLVKVAADKNLITIFNCRVCHSSGQTTGWVRRDVAVAHHPPHCYGSAESYVFKRYIRFVFCIPTGEDDDPDRQEKISDPDRREPEAPKARKPAARKATRKEIDAAKKTFTECESVAEMEEAVKKMPRHVKTNAEVVAHAKEIKRVLEDDIPPEFDGREPRPEESGDAETQQDEGAAGEEAPPAEEQPEEEAPAEEPKQEVKPPSKTKLNALLKQIGACNTESELTSVCQDLPTQWLDLPEMQGAIHEREKAFDAAERADGGGEGEEATPEPDDFNQAPPEDEEEPW